MKVKRILYPTKGQVLVCSGVTIIIDKANLEKMISKIRNKTDEKFVVGLIGYTRNNLKGIGTAIKAIGKLDVILDSRLWGEVSIKSMTI